MTSDSNYPKNGTKVLRVIVEDGVRGISNSRVAAISALNRDTVSAVCAILERSGLITTRVKGRWRSYYPTEKAIDLPSIFNYSRVFRQRVLQELILLDPYQSAFDDLNLIKEKFLREHFQFLKYEQAYLLSFTVKIGAIMTYILLQALSPELIEKITKQHQVKSKRTINRLIQDWVKEAISPLNILDEFSKEFRFQTKKSNAKLDESVSSYEIDQENIDKLLKTFASLFPSISKKLEHIYTNLENYVEMEKEKIIKTNCNHEFASRLIKGPHVSTLDSDYVDPLTSKKIKYQGKQSQGIKEFYCKVCGDRKTYVLEKEIVNKDFIDRLNFLSLKYQFASSDAFRCNNNRHEWIKHETQKYVFQLGYALEEIYDCFLCGLLIQLTVVDREAVKLMREAAKDRVGEDVLRLQIFNNIAYHFYNNQNEYASSQDLNYLTPKLLPGGMKYSDKDFKNDKEEILRILVECRFLDMRTTKECSQEYIFKRDVTKA